jgi:hypothetical protein
MKKIIIAAAVVMSVIVGAGCAKLKEEKKEKAEVKKATPVRVAPPEFDERFYDEGKSIQPTKDGGIVVAARTSSKGAGSFDVWLLKLDAKGQLLWERTYGGAEKEEAGSVIQSRDGGFVVAAIREYKGAAEKENGWIFKVDKDGSIVWDKTFGGDSFDRVHAVVETADGGFIAAGATASKGAGGLDGWVIRLDKDGAVEWDGTFGEEGRDELLSIQAIKDGGFVAAGTKGQKGSAKADGWVIRLGSDGKKEWEKTFGGDRWDSFAFVRPTDDGGAIAAGESQTNEEEASNLWLVKLGKEGDLQWEKQYGGPLDDRAASVLQAKDGNYVVCGKSSRKLSEEEAIVEKTSWGVTKDYLSSDLWVIKLEKNGAILWDKKYGGNNEDCADIAVVPEGYILTGWTASKAKRKSDVWVVSIDKDGGMAWDRIFGD